eukprot:COSAG04_NODE_2113_length_4765_cov_20.326832_6_plen_271_part_00
MAASHAARRWYAELDLPPHCTDDELSSAYRELAKRWHPDLHGGDGDAAERFQRISSAHTELIEHRKLWGAAEQPSPLGADARRETTGAAAASSTGSSGSAGGDWSRYSARGTGYQYQPGTPQPGAKGSDVNYMADNYRNHPTGADASRAQAQYARQFSGRGFQRPTMGAAHMQVNRATPQHYSATEGRVRSVLSVGVLLCGVLLAWSAVGQTPPWSRSTRPYDFGRRARYGAQQRERSGRLPEAKPDQAAAAAAATAGSRAAAAGSSAAT